MDENPADNPVERCGAKSRSGAQCRNWPMHGKRRCKFHGGMSTGAPLGNRNAWRHGMRSAEWRAMRAMLREMGRALSP